MPFDFETEPEFEKRLEWVREFVREEVWSLECVEWEMGDAAFRARACAYPPRRYSASVAPDSRWSRHDSVAGGSTIECAGLDSPSARSTSYASDRCSVMRLVGRLPAARRWQAGSRTVPRRCTRHDE